MVQRMRSNDPNRQHYDNAVLASAKHFIATGEGGVLFNPIRKTKGGPTTLTMPALVDFVAGKYIADYDKNTDYSLLKPTPRRPLKTSEPPPEAAVLLLGPLRGVGVLHHKRTIHNHMVLTLEIPL